MRSSVWPMLTLTAMECRKATLRRINGRTLLQRRAWITQRISDTLIKQMTLSQIEEGQRLASIEALRIQNPASHTLQEQQARAAIPAEVRREVWRRDGGYA